MNKHTKISFAVLFCFMLSSIAAFSQTITSFPYFDGFEDPAQDANWVLLNGTNTNKWYIGSGTANRGSRSLYVSATGGATVSYVNQSCGIVAYREITLPAGAQYKISFDYKLEGETNSTETVGYDTLLCYWVANSAEFPAMIPNVTGDRPALNNYRRNIQNSEYVRGGTVWHHTSFTVNGAGIPARMLLFWINNSTNIVPPAAAVDNLQIEKVDAAAACQPPVITRVSFDSGAKIEWTGTSPKYEIEYRNNATGLWGRVSETIYGSPYTLTDLPKGIYTFWLRGICGADTTAWVVSNNFLQAVESNKCLNYTDITNTDICMAQYAGVYENVFAHTGVMDFGYKSIKSQHTLHYIQSERDPLTLNKLPTVPPGEVASVRLGNWDPGNEQEALTYYFDVSPEAPILLLKYAAVLHDGGHDGTTNQQPHFLIRISDMQNRPINASCFNVDFKADRNAPGWHVIDPVTQVLPERPGDHPVLWKDWTSMGINLRQYAGRRVKIYLETGDCQPAPGKSGHFGYTYFTLNCIPDKLEGLTCGATAVDTILAPEGYRYEWYKAVAPTRIESRSRYFVPPAGDTCTYKCRIISAEPGRQNCYFELTAALLPRFPKADVDVSVCRRTVTLNDRSYVYTQNGKIDEHCDVVWEIAGDTISTEKDVVHTFAADGTYTVKLTAILDGLCVSDTSFTVTVTADTIKTIQTAQICKKRGGLTQSYTFGNRVLFNTGVYTDYLTTSYGCDSISVLNLTVLAPTAYDTICSGQPYDFEGKILHLPDGLHELVYKNVQSAAGCDSTLMLFVTEPIAFETDNFVCADETGASFRLKTGTAERVDIQFDFTSQANGFTNRTLTLNNGNFQIALPDSVRAGVYGGRFVFHNATCGVSEQDFSFVVRYRSDIVVQRWNDVLSVTNKKYNGGYEFYAYQWYKNGEKILGATNSYYYAENTTLDFEAFYTVELTRVDDGKVIMTCPFMPVQIADELQILVYPNAVPQGSSINVRTNEAAQATVYSATGIVMGKYTLNEGENILQMPMQKGIYIIQVRLAGSDEVRIFRVSVQ